MGKNLALISFKYGVSSLANIVINFHTGFSITLTILLVNVYLMQNMKKPIEIPVPLFFFKTLDLLWPKFSPEEHTHFTFFG